MAGPVNVFTSAMVSAGRGWQGITTRPAAQKPSGMLALYDREADPASRQVREVLTELDIDARIFPCPVGGTRYLEDQELSGKSAPPVLTDPDTGAMRKGARSICEYLYNQYAGRAMPLHRRIPFADYTASFLAGIPRSARGLAARKARIAEQPMELYSFEGSPFARLVRETLCELELSYILRNVGRAALSDWTPPPVRDLLGLQGAPITDNRQALLEKTGRVSIPYLVDPNTDTALFESRDIVHYLNQTYAL